jgi:hypothetical protein
MFVNLLVFAAGFISGALCALGAIALFMAASLRSIPER